MKIKSAADLQQNMEFKDALVELLYQLADDDFINSFRGSEWLGLCPHIEEDVAYSSITQNTMGHAAMFYQLLAEIGLGDADQLAHARTKDERRNAIILEEKNGTGTYLVEPNYDWAFAVVRNFFYDVAKMIRLNSLLNSSYEPLAQVARSVRSEQHYHIKHWEVWFKQLMMSTAEARERMVAQVEKVWKDIGGVLSLGPAAEQMVKHQLIEGEEELKNRWLKYMEEVFKDIDLAMPSEAPGLEQGDGRAGEHTEELSEAILTLSAVYNLDPAANW